MEEEKPQPVDLREEALLLGDGAAADVAVEVGAHDIHMQDFVVAEEPPRRRDLDSGDAVMAHALHMAAGIVDTGAPEPEPNIIRVGRRRGRVAGRERRAGAVNSFVFFDEPLPTAWITFPGAGAGAGEGARRRQIGQVHPFERLVAAAAAAAAEADMTNHGADVNQDDATPAGARGRDPTYIHVDGLARPLPLRISADAATHGAPASSGVAAAGEASSSLPVLPGDGPTAVPFPALESKIAPSGDASSSSAKVGEADAVFSSKRWSLLAEPDASTVLSGMEDVPDNGWYDSIAADEQMEELEEELDASFHERRPPTSSETPRDAAGEERPVKMKEKAEYSEDDEPYNPTADDEEEGGGALSLLPKLLARPSDAVDPDEACPSSKRRTTTTRVRVRPLDDDDVPKFVCGVCFDTLPIFDVFHGLPCEHRFCAACMVAYVEGRIADGAVPIPCPDPSCKRGGEGEGGDGDGDGGATILHPERCKKTIDFAAFTNWGLRLVESAVPASQRAYCANPRCGIMLIIAGGEEKEKDEEKEMEMEMGEEKKEKEKPVKAPCPACGHPLCAACGMEWSTDESGQHDCAKGPGFGLLRKLAADRRWKQCPRCKMMVERISGCRVMACRCRCIFCYQCGKPMGAEEGGGGRCQCEDHPHVVFN